MHFSQNTWIGIGFVTFIILPMGCLYFYIRGATQ